MSKKNGGSNSRTTQTTVMLRLFAGVYLVYLAYGLFQEYLKPAGGGEIRQIAVAALFGIIGAGLAGWSLNKYIKGDYIKNGQVPDDDVEDLPSTDHKEAE